jgi:hypothetical protein
LPNAAPAKLAYYGSRISPNQLETLHGYRVAMNVPICRTGKQQYLGSELAMNPGFREEWGIGPMDVVDVYRTLEEVTSPETIASFQGNSVVDDHPDGNIYPGSLVTVENDSELNRGHGQNIRVGPAMEDGEIPLLADLHLKHSDLIDKVDGGKRDVSCGYTYILARRDDGVLIQTRIRGNHIAIVEKGRAGPEVAIGDSAPPEIKPPRERTPMKGIRELIWGKGLKDYAKDASPEELASAMKELAKDAEPDSEKEKAAKDAMEKAAKDAAEKATKDAAEKAAKDAEEAKKKDEMTDAAKDRKAAHDALDRALDACATDKKMGKDAAGKDASVGDLISQLQEFFPPDEVAELDEELDMGKSGGAGGAEQLDGAAEVIEPEAGKDADEGDMEEGAMDDVKQLIKGLRPVIASGAADAATVKVYNSAVKKINALKGADPYKSLARRKAPEAATDSASTLRNPVEFYAGKTYKQGKADHEAYLAAQGGK